MIHKQKSAGSKGQGANVFAEMFLMPCDKKCVNV